MADSQSSKPYLCLYDIDLSVLYLVIFLLRLSSGYDESDLNITTIESAHKVSLEGFIAFMKEINTNTKLLDKLQHDIDLVMEVLKSDTLSELSEVEKGLTHLLLELFELTSQTPLSLDGQFKIKNSITVARRIKGFVQGLVHRSLVSIPTRRIPFLIYSLYICMGLKGVTNHRLLDNLHNYAVECMKITLRSLRISYSSRELDTCINSIIGWEHKHIEPKSCGLYYISRAFTILPCDKVVDPNQASEYIDRIKEVVDVLLDMNVVLSSLDPNHLLSSCLSVSQVLELPFRVLEQNSEWSHSDASLGTGDRYTDSQIYASSRSGTMLTDDRKVRRMGSGPCSAIVSDSNFIPSVKRPPILAANSSRGDSAPIPVPTLNLAKVLPSWDDIGQELGPVAIEEDTESVSDSISPYTDYSDPNSDDKTQCRESSNSQDTDRGTKNDNGSAMKSDRGPPIPPLQLKPTIKKYNRPELLSSNRMPMYLSQIEFPKKTLIQEAFLARLTLEHSRLIQMMDDTAGNRSDR